MRLKDIVSKEVFVWVLIPVFIIFFPILIVIFKTVYFFLFPLSSVVYFWFIAFPGYYYMESISLCVLNLYFRCIYGKGIGRTIIVLSLLTLVIIFVFQPIESYFIRSLFLSSEPQVFIDGIETSEDYLLKLSFWIHVQLTSNGRLHGIFGVFFGLISIYSLIMGSKSDVEERTIENSKQFLSFISLLSIVIALMIFSVQEAGYIYSLHFIFSITPLFLGVIFSILGMLVGDEMKNMNYILLFDTSIICFVIGFIFGCIAFPITKQQLMDLNGLSIQYKKQPLFVASPGIFFFMYMSMLFSSIGTYLISDRKCPLHKVIKKLITFIYNS